MKIACGSNDLKNFTKEHFGDSKYFLIYNIDRDNYKLLEKIENTSPKEELHSDPKKAKSIATTLNSRNVKAIFAYVIGPNIIRIRKKFVPIISRISDMTKALDKLKEHIEDVEGELNNEIKNIVYIE